MQTTKKFLGLGVAEASVAIFILLFVVGAGSYYTWSERVATETQRRADEVARLEAAQNYAEATLKEEERQNKMELDRLELDAEMREAEFRQLQVMRGVEARDAELEKLRIERAEQKRKFDLRNN